MHIRVCVYIYIYIYIRSPSRPCKELKTAFAEIVTVSTSPLNAESRARDFSFVLPRSKTVFADRRLCRPSRDSKTMLSSICRSPLRLVRLLNAEMSVSPWRLERWRLVTLVRPWRP